MGKGWNRAWLMGWVLMVVMEVMMVMVVGVVVGAGIVLVEMTLILGFSDGTLMSIVVVVIAVVVKQWR